MDNKSYLNEITIGNVVVERYLRKHVTYFRCWKSPLKFCGGPNGNCVYPNAFAFKNVGEASNLAIFIFQKCLKSHNHCPHCIRIQCLTRINCICNAILFSNKVKCHAIKVVYNCLNCIWQIKNIHNGYVKSNITKYIYL